MSEYPSEYKIKRETMVALADCIRALDQNKTYTIYQIIDYLKGMRPIQMDEYEFNDFIELFLMSYPSFSRLKATSYVEGSCTDVCTNGSMVEIFNPFELKTDTPQFGQTYDAQVSYNAYSGEGIYNFENLDENFVTNTYRKVLALKNSWSYHNGATSTLDTGTMKSIKVDASHLKTENISNITFSGSSVDSGNPYINLSGKNLTINFIDNDWETAAPDFYTVTNNNSKPFYVDSTFTHNGQSTLRSNVNLNDNETTSMSIEFTLAETGGLSFYSITDSEANYDYLKTTLDNIEIQKISGQLSSWQLCNKTNIAAGKHTLTFTFRKDTSRSYGKDGGAISNLTISGFMPIKYLLKINNKLYTYDENLLIDLGETNPSSILFETYGKNFTPPFSVLKGCNNFELLYWWNNNLELPNCSVEVKGIPVLPYTVVSEVYTTPTKTITDIEITGYEGYSNKILYSVSFDQGETWRIYSEDGKNWFVADREESGMTSTVLQRIPSSEWEAAFKEYNTNTYKFRIIIPSTSYYIDRILVYYIER